MKVVRTQALCKGKKNSARSKFFSKLMGILAGDFGNELSNAFVSNDAEKVNKMLGEVQSKIVGSMKREEAS